MSHATAHIDGASRGNPGPAALAVVLNRPGEPVVEFAEILGKTTNNVAEYTALLAALERAVELKIPNLTIFSDSELLVKQMNGEYRVKNADLQELDKQAQALKKQFTKLELRHVRREQNKRADELCNLALDGKLNQTQEGEVTERPQALPKAPPVQVGDGSVRDDCVQILESAAKSWAAKGPTNPPPAMVWEQIWSVLEEAGVLKKRKT